MRLLAHNGASNVQSLVYTFDAGDRKNGVRLHWQPVFGWDANGNRVQHGDAGGVSSLGYSANSNQLQWLTRAGSAARYFNHDADGNITASAGTSYVYDGFNRMSGATRDGLVTQYRVNALGPRNYKRVGSNGTAYLAGPSGQVEVEYNWGAQTGRTTCAWVAKWWGWCEAVSCMRCTTTTWAVRNR